MKSYVYFYYEYFQCQQWTRIIGNQFEDKIKIGQSE